jgi:hypothetical protein
MPETAGVIEVKRIVSDGVLGQQLDQLPGMEYVCGDDMRQPSDAESV